MQDNNTSQIKIFTIGFTKKGAKKFFSLLEEANIERLVDVRLRNRSQLSGFAKRDDLRYFLNELLGTEYVHNEKLAPSEELLDEWRDDSITWQEFEERFERLMKERAVEETISKKSFETRTVLLCSENKPQYCHRRLIIEYLKNEWGNVESSHLVE